MEYFIATINLMRPMHNGPMHKRSIKALCKLSFAQKTVKIVAVTWEILSYNINFQYMVNLAEIAVVSSDGGQLLSEHGRHLTPRYLMSVVYDRAVSTERNT